MDADTNPVNHGILLAMIRVTFLILLASLGSSVHAGTITINGGAYGWWDQTGFRPPTGGNLFVGLNGSFGETRDFNVFDLSGVTGTITSATLVLLEPAGGYLSPDASETFTLFDVSTSIAALTGFGSGQPGIFTDLGSGTSYGSISISAANNNTLISISLNAAGLSALNASIGGQFAIGGALTTLDHVGGGIQEAVFGSTNDTTRQLVLGTVPEPASLSLFTMGTLAILGKIILRSRR